MYQYIIASVWDCIISHIEYLEVLLGPVNFGMTRFNFIKLLLLAIVVNMLLVFSWREERFNIYSWQLTMNLTKLGCSQEKILVQTSN